MIDIDLLKAFDDVYGHLAGDECIRKIANVIGEIAATVRTAIAARYGGEEFAIILPDTNLDQAMHIAESLIVAIRALHIAHRFAEKRFVALSVGAATTMSANTAPDDLLRLADESLYRAKAAGRDGAVASKAKFTSAQG